MERVNLGYMDEGLRGWIFRTARKHFWRVASWYDLDDLVQDGYVVYHVCLKKFVAKGPTPADDQRRFQAYFSMAYSNHITDLANARTSTPEVAQSQIEPREEGHGVDLDERKRGWVSEPAVPAEAGFVAVLASAPQEIREALNTIIRADLNVEKFYRTKLIKRTLPSGAVRIIKGVQRLRETTIEHYDRCLGRPGITRALRDYLAEA